MAEETEHAIEYVRAIIKVADAIKPALDHTVYADYFGVNKITFWDGSMGRPSEYSLSYHDDELWFVYTPTEEVPF